MVEKSKELERAKEVLSKMDPELAMMAIYQSEVDFEEVNQIKEFLARFSPKTVQHAMAEMHYETMTKEIKRIKEQLKTFDIQVLQTAAAKLGIGSKAGLCFNGINCRGACVMVMVVRCIQDMYVTFKHDQIVDSAELETAVGRAAVKALKLADQLGEI